MKTAAVKQENTLSAGQVFLAFLKLGLTSFGGPVAHLGYFREEFVTRRQLLREETYADLMALCQFLPGPASSQVGIAVGLSQAGLPGALAAWTGFTLPSAVVLILFAFGVTAAGEAAVHGGWLHGLKIAAVAVVAQAVWGMAKNLCPDRSRRTMALAAAAMVLAAVVGLLLAALYTPVWSSGITSDFILGLAAFGLLTIWKVTPWIVVGLCSLGGALMN